MSEPQIIEVREKKHMWEVVTLDSTGRHRYSYWHKRNHPDQLSAFVATQQRLDGLIDGCDLEAFMRGE